MPKFVALLRGINVSGQKKIRMAELREHLTDSGFSNVETYIQSGNIVFNSTINKSKLSDNISQVIFDRFGFEVCVIVKNAAEIASAISENPFSKRKNADEKKIYVTFLKTTPQSTAVGKLREINYPPEEFQLNKNLIYFYSPESYGRAKMNNNFFEKKLKVEATTRNWKTLNILSEMLLK